jgi:RNA polymerase sigma-70 factor (ECF subfamily)
MLELVEACQRGEREAFRALFETYKNKVYSIALRFAGEEGAAMDIAQETFLKLFSSIQDFRGDSAFETWVYRMVVNSCLDRQRKLRRFVPLGDEFMATLRASGDALAAMLRAEMADRIRSAVDRLSPELRIVVVLRYTEGLSYDQIAEVLACSAGTVASRLNRAHKALERRLSHIVKEGSRHA